MSLHPFHVLVLSVALLSLLIYKWNLSTQQAARQMVPYGYSREIIFQAKPCLKGAFKDILLVIVYNYPYYESIPMFLQLYRPAFHRVVFCGPPGNTTYDVINVDIERGILGYQCLGRAVAKHPRFNGYLMMSDDIILNFWNLKNFDKSRIWQSSSSFNKQALYQKPKDGWYWWISPYGLENCQRAFEDVIRLLYGNKTKEKAEKWIETLARNGKGILHGYTGRSDILYIPGKFAEDFSTLSSIFFKRKVFLEIAIPTILRLLEDSERIGEMDGYYIPGDVRKKDPRVTDSRHFWMLYMWKQNAWFIHPYKLRHEQIDNQFNLAMFKHFLLQKARSYTQCQYGKSTGVMVA